MREKLKHLKHYFQFLRENNIKNHKFNSGDLQDSARPQRFQQPRSLMNIQVSLDPRSLMFGTTLKPSWKTSFLTMWSVRPSRNGETLRENSIPCLLMEIAYPDTMYYHEAMREPNQAEFIRAMQTEVQSHTKNGVWELVLRLSLQGSRHQIATREVYK